MPKGKPHPAELKARVALEVIRGDGTVNVIASDRDLNPNLVRKWAAKAESDMARAFAAAEGERGRERELAGRREEVDGLHRKIGELTAERDCLQRGLLARYGIDIENVSVDPANGAVSVSRQLEPPRFPNQVRGVDMIHVAVGRTHMHLTCVIDWCSRCIVGWRLAADMGAAPAELRREIADCVEQRNGVRPHQSLGNDRPSEWYHSGLMAA